MEIALELAEYHMTKDVLSLNNNKVSVCFFIAKTNFDFVSLFLGY